MLKTVILNENLHETMANKGKPFPLMNYYDDLNEWADLSVAWHWHEELEFLRVIQGRLLVSTSHIHKALSAGEGAFINSGVLHRMESVSKDAPVFIGQLVSSDLLNGVTGSVFENKYLLPILQCGEMEMLPLSLENINHRRILEYVQNSYDTVESESEGYEMLARNYLSSAWLALIKEIPAESQGSHTGESPIEARVKKMLLYIQEHYADKITLEEISASANISTRECLRNFQQCLHTTPFHYLIEHRLKIAAERLLSSGESVTDIAADCGFASGSYFTKLFREYFHMTPSEFRKADRD